MRPAHPAGVVWLLAAALLLGPHALAQTEDQASPPPAAAPPPDPVQAGIAHTHRDARLIKTAYLYNFLKFVRWPDAHRTEIKLCIARDAALAQTAQDALRDKRVGEIAVRVLGPGEDQGTCDLRYTARGVPASRPGELTVGEGRAFIEGGGMIAFAVVDDRVRFMVNLKVLRAAGLTADARLLTAALEVVQ